MATSVPVKESLAARSIKSVMAKVPQAGRLMLSVQYSFKTASKFSQLSSLHRVGPGLQMCQDLLWTEVMDQETS